MPPEIYPLTSDRWPDLAALFQTNSVTRGCWCMWFRQTTAEFRTKQGAPNKAAFKRIVERSDVPPGLLAYLHGQPAGWCAVAPRDDYPRIQRSRATKPIDDRPAWAITCFFVRKEARGRGVTPALLKAAVAFASDHGVTLIEGYPVDPATGPVTPDAAYHGLLPVFERAGFGIAKRTTERRSIVRLEPGSPAARPARR